MTNRVVKKAPARTPAGAGAPIDFTDYAGQDVEAAFSQPFWDDELYDDDGNPLGYDGSVYPSSNPWDNVQLGDYKLPGIWSAQAMPSLQLDIQKPRGYDGAALITRGYRPPWIMLTGFIGTPWQWARMQEVFPAIWTRPFKVAAQTVVLGKQGKIGSALTDEGQMVGAQRALTVVNPALNFLGITALVIQSISPPIPTDQPQIRQITLNAIEYVPVPPVKPPATKRIEGQSRRGKNAIDEAIEADDSRAPKLPSKTREGVAP